MRHKEQNDHINRNYKDSLFRQLFAKSKKNALSLYNALNDSSYTNEEDFSTSQICIVN